MEKLNLKEITAIELKYLGNKHSEIAEKIDTPFGTVDEWFSSRGKLFSFYQEYIEEMNGKRKEDMVKRVSLSDEEMFVLGTNIVRKFAQRVQGIKVPLVDKKGRAVLDEENKLIMVEEKFDISVGDFEKVWKMQRIMQGLPVNVEKQDISTEVKINSDEVIAKLGLTDEDFKEENYANTLKRITDYLRARGSSTNN